MSSFKKFKREIKRARFIGQLKSIKKRACGEHLSSEINKNQFDKLCIKVYLRINQISDNQKKRLK